MSDTPRDRRSARTAVGTEGGMMDANNQIALKLRALYREVEQEPIPDIFLDLLAKLDKAEQKFD
ncbi:NepR family anti-sigma factor [Pararhizobium gei]|uniref:NepR family anti-sigma factor n=1 Tax=Pararhizobium gei TaxID=1395951 RepID=UPI0023DABC70|nr:NepR family anti-sigma factor [Rhizobium gei]